MKDQIEKVKNFVKIQLGDEKYNQVESELKKNLKQNPQYDKDIVILGTLLSKLDQDKMLNYLETFKISLNQAEKIYDYIDTIK